MEGDIDVHNTNEGERVKVEDLKQLIAPVMDEIAIGPVDANLEKRLNQKFPAGGKAFGSLQAACHEAISDGWMCAEGEEGRRFGRVIEAAPETKNLSVDVVQLKDIIGPHHRHPTGEICMVMPDAEGATFDGQGAGWCVNEPNSAHRPTARNGQVLILYLLPDGEIEFTGR
jgi:Domain of unknown function (DUF4863)